MSSFYRVAHWCDDEAMDAHVPGSMTELLHDLSAEYERLATILDTLSAQQWTAPSAAPGWTVRDVVLHLALTEEAVIATLERPSSEWQVRSRSLDDELHETVATEAGTGDMALIRWREATRGSIRALAAADPNETFRWAAAPLRPRTLATTRLAEHWAHALDVCEPLGLTLTDTPRLRHIAWLGHATLPYAFRLVGEQPVPVHCHLTTENGSEWEFGPSDAQAHIVGDIGRFCRVGARRLRADESGLRVEGPGAARALELLRNYAA
jgi:uncharacterized protein (TIGR03084 family)